MIELVNQSRLEAGLESLSVNSQLVQAANLKAGDMLEFDYFDHTSPAGIDPWHWIGLAGYNYHYAGENLAIDFVTAGGAHQALMESSSHRENILNSHFKEVGVAVLQGEFEGLDSIVVVEIFASPMDFRKMNINKNKVSGEVNGEISGEVNGEVSKNKEINQEINQEIEPALELDNAEPDNHSPNYNSETDLKSDLELSMESNLEPESKLEPEPVLKPELNASKELFSQEKLNLLAIVLVKKNSDIINGYLASGLYFGGSGEVFKKQKRGMVLASANSQPLGYLENSFVYLLSLVLGIDLLISLILTFKHTNI